MSSRSDSLVLSVFSSFFSHYTVPLFSAYFYVDLSISPFCLSSPSILFSVPLSLSTSLSAFVFPYLSLLFLSFLLSLLPSSSLRSLVGFMCLSAVPIGHLEWLMALILHHRTEACQSQQGGSALWLAVHYVGMRWSREVCERDCVESDQS